MANMMSLNISDEVIKAAVKEEIEKYIEENREEFATEVRKQLKNTNFHKKAAESFLKTLTDVAGTSWKMPIRVSFEKPED